MMPTIFRCPTACSRPRTSAADAEHSAAHWPGGGCEMTDIGEKIKQMGFDKSKFESLMQSEFSSIVTAKIVDIEVLPAEKGSANLFLRSSKYSCRRPMRMEEAFWVMKALLSAGFDVLSCDKSPIDQNPRASEMYGSLSSWFILS